MSNLAYCQHSGYLSHNCGHGEDAGVTCSSNSAPLMTRLVGGRGPNEGRVEVYYQGSWGTVCDDLWYLDDAHVVCRSLGYMQASAYHYQAHFGQGSGNIVLDNVGCKGFESNLAFCQHYGYLAHNCGHIEDAGATCDGIELETRLANGRGPFEGRVEVFYQGSWGTICDDNWDLVDAHVVCHTLGYPRALSYHRSAYFGEGTGDIILDDIDCSGTESNIAVCQHNGFFNSSCEHSKDAGVTCSVTDRVRLVDGGFPNEGRVEVNYQGSWGTICDDFWDINDASIICRMLGYPGPSSILERFGQGTGNIALDDVRCDGTEMSILQCGHNGFGVHNCNHSKDVGLRCNGEAELSLRLNGGRRENEGRVELLYMGEWSNVCQYGWTTTDSDVVCRSLGFLRANETSLSFGGGPGNVVLRKPECSGKESSLLQCQGFRFDYSYCGHTEALGISCLNQDEIQVRLVGGDSDEKGRVEANFNGTWGTVCDDNWDLDDANVVCRMLGFERADSYTCCAGYGEGSGPIFLNEVECDGTESNIGNCSRSDYKVNDCDHSEDVGVSCIEYGSSRAFSKSLRRCFI
ncbi:deleted in malignant brain tumors 1 protein-like [Lytechinus pictus]|uniref:deleted in malignant brain tumors 1 protein-like n=1 Tax=Lytechinus pictus TaxID=7653 RepID=UPI0030B9EB8C